jgi:hypothetical protein
VSITEELLEWKSRGSGFRKPRLTAVGICCADHATHSMRKFGTNFADTRPSLGRYSSLADKKATEFSFKFKFYIPEIFNFVTVARYSTTNAVPHQHSSVTRDVFQETT